MRARGSSVPRISRELLVVPVLLATWHLAVLALLWSRGEVEGAPAKLAVVVAASAAMAVLFLRAPVPKRPGMNAGAGELGKARLPAG